MAEPAYIPLKPIPIKDRSSILFIEYGRLDVKDGAFVVVEDKGIRVQIPVGALACVMLEPGTRVSHAAVVLAAKVGCLLVWVGEGAVRLYSAGQPGGARADRLLYQAKLALDDTTRLKVVRKMYAMRFAEDPPERRSVDQLRGMEGARVRRMYQNLAQKHGVKWKARKYDQSNWDNTDLANKCLSAATSCLYGLSEAAILAAGYAPAIGFLHRGRPQSFVYDIADIFKFETVVPEAFRITAAIQRGKGGDEPAERQVRKACRDSFRKTKLLDRIIPSIQEILSAGEILPPEDAPEGVEPVIGIGEQTGNDGHRN